MHGNMDICMDTAVQPCESSHKSIHMAMMSQVNKNNVIMGLMTWIKPGTCEMNYNNSCVQQKACNKSYPSIQSLDKLH